jgi:hypothetical protein
VESIYRTHTRHGKDKVNLRRIVAHWPPRRGVVQILGPERRHAADLGKRPRQCVWGYLESNQGPHPYQEGDAGSGDVPKWKKMHVVGGRCFSSLPDDRYWLRLVVARLWPAQGPCEGSADWCADCAC